MGNTCSHAHPTQEHNKNGEVTHDKSAAPSAVGTPSPATSAKEKSIAEVPKVQATKPTEQSSGSKQAQQKLTENAPKVTADEVKPVIVEPVGRAPQIVFAFKPRAPLAAKLVTVSGSFNNWKGEEDPKWHLKKNSQGVYELKVYDLAPGTYHYKFKVDGEWVEDAEAKDVENDGFGGKNAVFAVVGEQVSVA